VKTAVSRRRSSLATLALLAAGLVSPRSALAMDVPSCGGHVTDTGHMLGERTYHDIDTKLDKLAHETLVDSAMWLADGPRDTLETLGHEAYKRWGIGAQWNNGLLVIIPKTGRAFIVQDEARPDLTADEMAKVVSWDEPDKPMERRVDQVSESLVTLLRPKEDRHIPAHRIRYVFGPVALLLAAWLLRLRGQGASAL